jgi:DNA-directed RNA polymerase beta subunit
MKHYLKDYVNEWEDQLNVPLMTKSADAPLVDYIIDAWKSLEVVPQIEFSEFQYTEKESEIDINKHLFKRDKKKKKKDRYDIKFIDDDRVGKLTVKLNVTMLETNPTTGESSYQVYPIKKSMLIPLQDDDGYFTIKGKKYYMIYQLLEKSTYTSSSSVTLKSLMPIAVKRNIVEGLDSEGLTHQLPVYSVFVFRKEIPILLFYMSKGAKFTIDYLHMNNVVRFLPKEPTDDLLHDKNLYFQLSSKCVLEVDRDLFYKYPYVQSIVGGYVKICNNRTTMDMLEDPKVWIKKISSNNYEKGLGILKYFGRLLDNTTKKVLKVPEYYKSDIYALLRWIMEHFNELRLKDNCDLSNKRLRCNEYIASLLTKEFSKRLNRIISLGNKATIDNIKEIFKFPGDILIQKMHTSGILRFDDNVNDMTFWSKFKYTSKGPHSLGGHNANNIGIKYRDLHPSMLGQIDVLVC